MKKINNYWVDENNNRWSCDWYSEEIAEQLSKTLINCSGCIDCIDCIDCRDCRDCRGCSYCSGCRGYNDNPMRYVSPRIGSRNDNTTFYYLNGDMQIVCGCFRGDLEEFERAVRETHKNNEKHLADYLKEIEKVKVLFEIGA